MFVGLDCTQRWYVNTSYMVRVVASLSNEAASPSLVGLPKKSCTTGSEIGFNSLHRVSNQLSWFALNSHGNRIAQCVVHCLGTIAVHIHDLGGAAGP